MQKRVLQHLRRASRSFGFGSLEKSDRPRRRTSRSSTHLVTAVAALGVSGAGCSLLYDLSGEQCTTSADCNALFGQDYVCNAAQICEAPPPPTGSSGSGGSDSGSGGDGGNTGGSSGAVSNGGSGDVGGSAGQGGGPELECTTNAECMADHGDAAWMCRNNSCLELLSDECPFVLGLENLRTSNNPIIFGAYTLINPNAPLNTPMTANYELAINEFTAGAPGGGLDSASGRRKMVAVVCDAGNPATIPTSLTHLISTVNVPAVITPLPSADLVTLFESHGRAAGVFFMSPFDADSSLTTLDDDGLVWNILGSAATLAPTYVPLLARAEALIKTQQAPLSTIKVALIDDDTDFMGDISGVLTSSSNAITFNGLSISENIANGDYEGFTIPVDSAAPESGAIYDAVVTELLEFKPHIIISATDGTFVTEVMEGLENGDQWDTGVQPRPFYLMSPFHRGLPALADLVTNKSFLPDPGDRLSPRVLGVNFESALDPAVRDAYRIRFNNTYQLDEEFENFYDAAWYLMYAFAAAGEVGTYTGRDVKRGMDRLVNLDAPALFTFTVGGVAVPESDVPVVLQGIEQSAPGAIQLIGTMGPPDFDPGTGARNTKGSVYCVTSGIPATFQPDVLRYDSTGPALVEGSPSSCIPAGF